MMLCKNGGLIHQRAVHKRASPIAPDADNNQKRDLCYALGSCIQFVLWTGAA